MLDLADSRWSRYLSKFGYEIGSSSATVAGVCRASVSQKCAREWQGTGSFNFRFQLAAPKSIPEPAVLQLEVYLDAGSGIQVLIHCLRRCARMHVVGSQEGSSSVVPAAKDEHWPEVEAEPNFCERQKRSKQALPQKVGSEAMATSMAHLA